MPALQRIRTGRMFLDSERRRLPPVHCVAGSALAVIRPPGKLPIVRIGLVTIHALREDQGLLEVAIGVALGAIDADVLPLQGKLGFRVVEALIHGGE